MQQPGLPDPAELERNRLAAAERDAKDMAGFEAWNHERTARIPNIWVDRAPPHAIGELIHTLACGGRIRLPGLIAAMRAEHDIPATAVDARRLAAAGFTPDEITTALS